MMAGNRPGPTKWRDEEYVREYHRRWRAAFQEKNGASPPYLSMLKKFGKTLDDYDAETVNGCQICGAQPEKERLCLDHDHETGEFRGWLCRSCNAAIGLFGEDVNRVVAAAAYLMREE